MDSEESFRRFASTEKARKDLRGNSIRGFGYVVVSSGGEFILRIASTAVLARLISPEEFGLFMMVTAVTAAADQFRDLGLSTATIQRETITNGQVSNLFWINASAGVVLAALVCALAPVVALYFHEPRLTAMTSVLAATFVFGGLTVQHEALLARQMKLGQKSMFRFLAFLLSSTLAIALALNGWGYWALVWRELARSAFIVLGAVWACPWLPCRPDRKIDVRDFVRFGRNITLTYSMAILTSSLDRFLLGRAYGPIPVALYRQPYQLVVAPMNQFMNPLYQVMVPALSMLQGKPDAFSRYYDKIVMVVAALSMPLSVFLAIYAEELTLIVLGADWIGSATFLRIFAIGGFLRSISATPGHVLVSHGRSKELLWLGLANTVVMAALMTLGLHWGPQGVAWGEVGTIVLMLIPSTYVSFRDSPVSCGRFWRASARPATTSLVMMVALFLLKAFTVPTSPSVSLTAGAVVSGLSLLTSWLVLPGGRRDIQSLVSAVLGAVRTRGVVSA